jgi:NADH dehydrogenase [ubiquinone] 1 alpha subcomplex assembly factor 7
VSYDPDARRDTPLAVKLKARIRERGAITIKDYMEACLQDAEHGYYRAQAGIGAAGDFITAPEISQVFGELLGLWSAVVWQQMGKPASVNLVELGPGRGTMMRDVLRAAATVPGYPDALKVFLIEPNPALRRVQQATLADARVAFDYLEPPNFPDGPSIILANEVLDCLPVWQFERVGTGNGAVWRERTVEIGEGDRLQFGLGRTVPLRPGGGNSLPPPEAGDILEDRNARGIIGGIGETARSGPVAALLIDYGHKASGYGDTLQAIRAHTAEHPLTSPGEADLTAHVDFAAFQSLAREWSARPDQPQLAIDGPVTQAEFLGRLGIMERASILMAANPGKASSLEMGVARLMAPNGMGTRFKVIGLRSPHLPPLPGF